MCTPAASFFLCCRVETLGPGARDFAARAVREFPNDSTEKREERIHGHLRMASGGKITNPNGVEVYRIASEMGERVPSVVCAGCAGYAACLGAACCRWKPSPA